MLQVGKVNHLSVLARQLTGLTLGSDDSATVFLPERDVPQGINLGDELDVFVYLASDRQLVATTQKPVAQVDDIAWLRVSAVNDVGAFLDWGLPKELLVPFNEQRHKLQLGRNYLVKILYDEQYGIFATPNIDPYVYHEAFYLSDGQAVQLLIADRTDVGFKAIVNNTHWGLLYHNEIFQVLHKGLKISGFIKRIREDDRRIDLSLYPPGYAKVGSITDNILQALRQNHGYLPLGDKSSPELIYAQFGVSKKVFKQAIGSLYKQRLLVIEDEGIRLL